MAERPLIAVILVLVCASVEVSSKAAASSTAPRVFPHFVSIRMDGLRYPHLCSGSILNEHWILTTATCIPYSDMTPVERNLADMHIAVGIARPPNTGKRYPLERSIVHPQFEEETMANNIGLLKTQKPMTFDVRTQPILLANKFVADNGTGMVIGYNQVKLKRFENSFHSSN